MSKRALIRWSPNQMRLIKRDLLFFDKLYYDPFLLKLNVDFMDTITLATKSRPQIIDEIYTTVGYLKKVSIVEEVELSKLKKEKVGLKGLNTDDKSAFFEATSNYDYAYNTFLKKHEEAEKSLSKDYQSGFLKYINLVNELALFSDNHVRLTSLLFDKLSPQFSVTPIIDNLSDITGGKETQVIHIVINNLPIPDELVPLDEVIDFRNDSDTRRRYLGLINWVNKVVKSNNNIIEIEQELEYLTLEFENRLKLEKQKYRLTNLEIVMSLPLEIVEKIIKLEWSEIPKIPVKIRKNKVNLMIGESKAPGKEVAYLTFSNEKFSNN